MRLVAALGGNALLRRDEPAEASAQLRNVEIAVRSVAVLAREHDLVVTHGNGPQVGLLALESEAYQEVRAYPLDVLGAESQGMIGYLLAEAMHDELPDRQVVTLLTQVVVDAGDLAFAAPTKFIGPTYTKEQASALAAQRGWSVAADGAAYRRVVASPEPCRVLEVEAVRLLLEAGVLVICAGGGGVPVVLDNRGATHGVEAVVDKDLTSALLAGELAADGLLLLTDVDAVYTDWGTLRARAIRLATPDVMRSRSFAAGSMGPKVEAACRFVERTGGFAAIGALEDAGALLAGDGGTRVEATAGAMTWWS